VITIPWGVGAGGWKCGQLLPGGVSRGEGGEGGVVAGREENEKGQCLSILGEFWRRDLGCRGRPNRTDPC